MSEDSELNTKNKIDNDDNMVEASRSINTPSGLTEAKKLPCEKCDDLMAYISDVIKKTKDSRASGELSYVLKVLPDLSKKSDDAVLSLAKMSIRCLSEDPPNLEVGKVLNREIRRKLSVLASVTEMLKSSKSSSNYVLLGLGLFLYLMIPIGTFIYQKVINVGYIEILGIDLYLFMIVIIFGALGSIVSILSRIKDYDIATEKDISILFYTGMFKPIVGSAFALFVYALVKGKLLPIAITKDTEIYIYISLAFLSGFSERFTKDVVGNAEKLGMGTTK